MFKFNGGKGAVCCDECRKTIAENVAPTPHNRRKILCAECKRQKVKSVES